jgi:flagellar basal body-associated protein FliL
MAQSQKSTVIIIVAIVAIVVAAVVIFKVMTAPTETKGDENNPSLNKGIRKQADPDAANKMG